MGFPGGAEPGGEPRRGFPFHTTFSSEGAEEETPSDGIALFLVRVQRKVQPVGALESVLRVDGIPHRFCEFFWGGPSQGS